MANTVQDCVSFLMTLKHRPVDFSPSSPPNSNVHSSSCTNTCPGGHIGTKTNTKTNTVTTTTTTNLKERNIPSSFPLAADEDEYYLDPLQCFIRKYCVEYYFIQRLQSKEQTKTGKEQACTVSSRVGVRCVFCHGQGQGGHGHGHGHGGSGVNKEPLSCSSSSNTSYMQLHAGISHPVHLNGICSAVGLIQCRHLLQCTHMPNQVRNKLLVLCSREQQQQQQQQRYYQYHPPYPRTNWETRHQYWIASAKHVGVYESHNGLCMDFMTRPAPANTAPSFQQRNMLLTSSTTTRKKKSRYNAGHYSNNSNAIVVSPPPQAQQNQHVPRTVMVRSPMSSSTSSINDSSITSSGASSGEMMIYNVASSSSLPTTTRYETPCKKSNNVHQSQQPVAVANSPLHATTFTTPIASNSNTSEIPYDYYDSVDDYHKSKQVLNQKINNDNINIEDIAPIATTTKNITNDEIQKLIGTTNLVQMEDRDLVPDYLFVAIGQMTTCHITEEDRVGCYKNRPLDFTGMCCKHCGGQPGVGKYFPGTVRSLAQTTTSQTIVKHVAMKCNSCPPEVRIAIMSLQREEQDNKDRGGIGGGGGITLSGSRGNTFNSEKSGTGLETKPRYGSRKIFFQRLWSRLHEGRVVSPSNSKPTLTTVEEGKENVRPVVSPYVDRDNQPSRQSMYCDAERWSSSSAYYKNGFSTESRGSMDKENKKRYSAVSFYHGEADFTSPYKTRRVSSDSI